MAIAPIISLSVMIGVAGAGTLVLAADRSGLARLVHRVFAGKTGRGRGPRFWSLTPGSCAKLD